MSSLPLTPHRAFPSPYPPNLMLFPNKTKKDTKPPQKCKNENLNKQAKDQQDEKKTHQNKIKAHENMLSLF